MARRDLLHRLLSRVYWDAESRTLKWNPGADGRTAAHTPVRSEYITVGGTHLSVYHVVWFIHTKQVVDRCHVLSRVHGDGSYQSWRVLSRRDAIMLGKNPDHQYRYRNWMGQLKASHA